MARVARPVSDVITGRPPSLLSSDIDKGIGRGRYWHKENACIWAGTIADFGYGCLPDAAVPNRRSRGKPRPWHGRSWPFMALLGRSWPHSPRPERTRNPQCQRGTRALLQQPLIACRERVRALALHVNRSDHFSTLRIHNGNDDL